MQEFSKTYLRKKFKSQRALFARSAQVAGDKSAGLKVQQNVQKLIKELKPQLKTSSEVWAYKPYSDEAPCEINTVPKSTEVAFPKIVGDRLEFYIPKSSSDMEPNHYGILEPMPEKCQSAKSPALIVVPGVGFDRHGTRLGSGKGFYDRVLNEFPKAIRVGVAFSVQISNEVLPVEAHDQPMDWIVTENFILQCERRD